MAKATKTNKVISRKAQSHLIRERTQRKFLIIGIITVLIIIIGIIAAGLIHEFVLKANEPVAKIGNQDISTQDFQTRVRYQRWQNIQQYTSTLQQSQMFAGNESLTSYFSNTLSQIASQLDDHESIGNKVLDQMIDEVIVIQEAEARGYSQTDVEVSEKLQTLFGYYQNGTPTSEPSPTTAITSTFSPTQLALITIAPTVTQVPTQTSAVTATSDTVSTPTIEPSPYPSSTPISLEGYQELKTTYFDQLSDIEFNEDDLKEMIRADLYREKLFNEITADVPAEEERVWARHILVEDESIADDIYQKLIDGEDFSLLAAENSTDTSNKDQGGDLGWFPRGQMVAEFEDVAFELSIGEISKPVQTSFGYHIIQVLGHEIQPLSDSELQTAQQKVYDDWFAQLKSEKIIEKYDRWKDRIPVEPTLPPEMLY